MVRAVSLTAIALLCLATPALSQSGGYGPPVEWDQYKKIGTAALKARLIDPDSAKIIWPWVARPGRLIKRDIKMDIDGYWTCGFINSKNRFGGYVGNQIFLIVMRNGEVSFSDIAVAGEMTIALSICSTAIEDDRLVQDPDFVMEQ